MKTARIFLIVLILTGALAAQTGAPPQTQQVRPQDPISVDVNEVNVVFAVTDKKGKFITNLKKEDFRVYEDDKPQAITSFRSETDLPLTITLLVDTSGSIRDKLKFEQEAAIEFFYSTLKRGKDKAAVIGFDSGVDLLQDFTDDPEVLAKAVNGIRIGGGTALFDAVFLATTEKLAKQGDARRVVILIGDGDDNSSRASITEALETTQKHEVVLYAISTNQTAYFGTSEQDRGDKTLKQFATETGGRAFFPSKVTDLAASFQDIHDELRSQYAIAYTPPSQKADGAFHKLRVEIVNKQYKDLKVRARTGYYAVKPTASTR
jgi:Ca-activated chloride channel family protein